MNALIIIEGPRFVGKSYLTDYLEHLLGYPVYYPNKLPREAWKYDDYILSCLYDTDLKIITHRGALSTIAYGTNSLGILQDWLRNLEKWDYGKVVCLESSSQRLLENAQRRNVQTTLDNVTIDMNQFKALYNLVPDYLKIYISIKDNDEQWLEQIGEIILGELDPDVVP